MLDDDRLSALLSTAGTAFEVPAHGIDDILSRAAGPSGGGDERPAPERDGARSGDDGVAGSPEASPTDTAPDASGVAPGASGARRLVALAERHRVLTAAAGVVALLVVAGTLGTLVARPAHRTATSSLAPVPGVAVPRATTTLPASPDIPRAAGGVAPGFQPAFGLHKSAQGGAGSTGAATAQAPATTTPTLPTGAVGQSAKIEQSGSLALGVGRGRLDRTMAELAGVATANGGFVASSQTQSGAGSGNAPSGSVTLQVPVADFSAALSQAQALGRTTSLSTKATDVTGQYVDLQARIAALEASRQQYLTILAKAQSIGDVLSVQEQLDGIQTQIEQLQGQLQLLTAVTAYSTLAVTVSEGSPPPAPGPRPESGLARAWHDSVGGFVAGVEGLIRVAGPVLFALLCLGVLVVGGRVLWRRWQRHRL